MNKLILISILLGIAVVVSVLSLSNYSETPSQPQSKSIYEVGFTFNDVDKIKSLIIL